MGWGGQGVNDGIGHVLDVQKLLSGKAGADGFSDFNATGGGGVLVRVGHDQVGSLDVTGANGGDGDTGSDQFPTGNFRQGFDKGLTGTVDGEGLELAHSSVRRDGENATLATLHHFGNDGSKAIGHTLDVDVNRSIPLIHERVRHLCKIHDSRTVDHNVHRPELALGLFHQGGHRLALRHIAFLAHDFPGRVRILRACRLGRFLQLGQAPCPNAHGRPFLHQRLCNRRSNARRRSRQHCHLTLQTIRRHSIIITVRKCGTQ
mmetsp:Transcript_21616/g.39098  ORF Transcript_21616/g.39098 Transcript_21616/m.39098 type:complete len:261 (+) Transcript_21616:76-858(+)